MNNEDLSGIFEKLNGQIDKDKISPDMVNNLLSMLGNSSNNSSSPDSSSGEVNSDNSSGANSIDPATLLKMKSIIEQMNVSNNDPRSNLLQSLKPYLKDSRKGKLDQYIQFMNMSKMMNFLPFMGGGKNKDE
jgi:hypothetical protein